MEQMQMQHLWAATTFTIESKVGHDFADLEGAPKLSGGSFVFRYSGEMEGQGRMEELHYHGDSQSFESRGYERFSGSIGGRSGSLVFETRGRFYDGQIHSTRSIIPGSGTGELSGIRGLAGLVSGPAPQFEMKLEYWFEES